MEGSSATGGLVYCPQCGQRMTEEQRVCAVCGAVVSEEVTGGSSCPHCHAPCAPDDTYCRQCGAVLPLDLAALGLAEPEATAATSGGLELPEWLLPQEGDSAARESAVLRELDLPEWLREPGDAEPRSIETGPIVPEVAVPVVAAVWVRPAASEPAAEHLFAPLPLLHMPELTAVPPATASDAGMRASDRSAVRVALLLALVVLVAIAAYIVWASR